MASAITIPLRSTPTLLPRLSAPVLVSSSRWVKVFAHPISHPLIPYSLPLALPSVSLNVPALLGDIWESVLRAVPKKKTSYSRTRSRQLAGKALKDVTSLCQCPGCGQPKRTHRVCSDCLSKVHAAWKRQAEDSGWIEEETVMDVAGGKA